MSTPTPARSFMLPEHADLDDLEVLTALRAQIAHKLHCSQYLISRVNDEVKRAKLVRKASERQRQLNALDGAIHTERQLAHPQG